MKHLIFLVISQITCTLAIGLKFAPVGEPFCNGYSHIRMNECKKLLKKPVSINGKNKFKLGLSWAYAISVMNVKFLAVEFCLNFSRVNLAADFLFQISELPQIMIAMKEV